MLLGIDTSDCQGKIDWAKVKASGVSFAFCKATDGETFVSKTFKQNWNDINRDLKVCTLCSVIILWTQCRIIIGDFKLKSLK